MSLFNWPNHSCHCKKFLLYYVSFHSGRWFFLEDASISAKSCTVKTVGSVQGVTKDTTGTTSSPATLIGGVEETFVGIALPTVFSVLRMDSSSKQYHHLSREPLVTIRIWFP